MLVRHEWSIGRRGIMSNVVIGGIAYCAMIWREYGRYSGCISGRQDIPHHHGPSPLAVRNALSAWLVGLQLIV